MRLLVGLLLLFVAPLTGQRQFDLLIRGGLVADGRGGTPYASDVGVYQGRIAGIGELSSAKAHRVIDASGLVVAPGFIDMHNHSDETLLAEPRCESMVRQGVTTMVLGEGGSAGPIRKGEKPWTSLGGYLRHVEIKGVSTNICSYVGQTQIWTHVKGEKLQPASAEDLVRMKAEVAAAMLQGAMGLSTSLLMPPSSLVTTGQLVELAEVAAQHGGIYSTHIRDEGLGVFESIQEAIDVGKGAGIGVDIIHMKIADEQLWGQMPKIIAMIDAARGAGHDIRAHVYPYTAGQNNLRSIIPPWAHDGGNEPMLERLRAPESRARMRRDIVEGIDGWYNHYLAVGSDWSRMLLVGFSSKENQRYVGKRMSDLVADRGGDPIDVLFDVLLEENGSVRTVFSHHSEQDMQFALEQPYVSVGSDGAAITPKDDLHPHPRWFGTFPRILGRYVRKLKTLELGEAIAKITSMNADKIGILDRGQICSGYWADITIFNPNTVIDQATFENPQRYPVGIEYVIVNGEMVLERGKHTGARAGQVIRGPGWNGLIPPS